MTVKTIWKFKLPSMMNPIVIMPKKSKIIKVSRDSGGIFIWAIVNPDAQKVERLIRIFKTGQPLSEEHGQYIDSIKEFDHTWHLFDGGERPFDKQLT